MFWPTHRLSVCARPVVDSDFLKTPFREVYHSDHAAAELSSRDEELIGALVPRRNDPGEPPEILAAFGIVRDNARQIKHVARPRGSRRNLLRSQPSLTQARTLLSRGSSACGCVARATRATRASGGGAPRALREVQVLPGAPSPHISASGCQREPCAHDRRGCRSLESRAVDTHFPP